MFKNIFLILLCCVAVVVGCSRDSVPSPRSEGLQEYPEYEQRCEMCGAEWRVQPADPDAPAPAATVEWCFHDGSICETGLDLIIAQEESGETSKINRDWLNHCFQCKGCRCATFEPDQWRTITDTLKRIREEKKSEVSGSEVRDSRD